ncbi:MAG: polyprenol monophosphomannose synthase [Acidobacteriota bacterium]|nr:polyprenol monophosphomannose synthase [Acidobacteriota bacterium]
MRSSYAHAPEPSNRSLALQPSISVRKIAVVIPTLREAGSIHPLVTQVIAELEKVPLPFEVIVVDDDSRDGVDVALAPIIASDSRVRLLIRTGERGLAGAILHGWRSTDAEFLAVMDADLQHPPSLLPKLAEALCSGNDLAVASRYWEGKCLDGWHPVRRLISRTAIWATGPLLPRSLRVCDPMSGYFCVRRSCMDGIEFETKGFKLLLEILVRGRIRSLQELPFVFGHRTAGKSKAGPRVALHYFQLLRKLYRLRSTAKLALRQAPAD